MKRYAITYGDNTLRCERSLNISEIDNELFETEKTLFETFDEAEATEKFAQYKCDCNIQKTLTGYEATLDIYELVIDDGKIIDGEFQADNTETIRAPFILEDYICYD